MVRTGEKNKAASESRANICLGEVSVTLVTSQSAYFSRTVPFIINKFSLDPLSHVEHFRHRRHPVHFPKSDYSDQLQGLNVILKKGSKSTLFYFRKLSCRNKLSASWPARSTLTE